jgi:predicted  nucleic acid-binding Zn-ribbon protein
MLEDELRRLEEHGHTLRSEIDSLNESLTLAQRQALADRQRLCQVF